MGAYIGDRKVGFLFETENGKMLSPESLFRDGFKTILKKMGRTGVRFHAFRRFRESVLLASDARQILIDYWMGHENPDMSTRYGKQLVEDAGLTASSGQKKWDSASTYRRCLTRSWALVALRALQIPSSKFAARVRK